MTLGATRQTIAQRLLADYRTTGILPRISGGDHDGETNGDTGENQDDQNGDANSGGEQGGSSGDNGFKAITSQAELDNLIGKRLDRERRKLAKELRDEITSEITEEARRKEAEEQGDYKKLLDDLQPKYDTAVTDLEAAQQRLDMALKVVNDSLAATWDTVPEEVRDLYDGADDDALARQAFLAKPATQKLIERLTEKAHTPGNGPNPKPSDGKRDIKAAEDRSRPRYRA